MKHWNETLEGALDAIIKQQGSISMHMVGEHATGQMGLAAAARPGKHTMVSRQDNTRWSPFRGYAVQSKHSMLQAPQCCSVHIAAPCTAHCRLELHTCMLVCPYAPYMYVPCVPLALTTPLAIPGTATPEPRRH